ncbi:MAG: hypothetical protein KJ646_00345 [Nanoarchaeota archaeon]|nr:hypothetical protein [Nanoarchaeota archaeon]MBU4116348.1 hypothetical protein [Nanoarchaeota archaeon]
MYLTLAYGIRNPGTVLSDEIIPVDYKKENGKWKLNLIKTIPKKYFNIYKKGRFIA